MRALETQAIRAQQVDAVAPRNLHELRSQNGVDPARHHERAAALDAPGQFQSRSNVLAGQCNHGQIGRHLRQIGQRAAAVHVQKGQLSCEALRLQRRQQDARLRGLRSLVFGVSAKHDDGTGREQGRKEMLVH